MFETALNLNNLIIDIPKELATFKIVKTIRPIVCILSAVLTAKDCRPNGLYINDFNKISLLGMKL